MKTAAKILGITGGGVCLIYVIVSVLSGPEAAHMEPRDFILDTFIYSVLSMLGIAGGMLVKRKTTMAGAFMLLSALLNINRSEGFLLTLLGAVFALALGDIEPAPGLSDIKRVAKGLGAAGGIIGIIMASLYIISIIFLSGPTFKLFGAEYKFSLSHADALAVVLFITAIISIIPGFLGIKLIGKKNTAAGVIMIAGAVLAIPDILVSMFLLLGGIFALIPEKKSETLKEELS